MSKKQNKQTKVINVPAKIIYHKKKCKSEKEKWATNCGAQKYVAETHTDNHKINLQCNRNWNHDTKTIHR